MGDGWETKRSRTPGHTDWVILRLYVLLTSSWSRVQLSKKPNLRGAPGYLNSVEIDTIHFIGNYPESCTIDALNSSSVS